MIEVTFGYRELIFEGNLYKMSRRFAGDFLIGKEYGSCTMMKQIIGSGMKKEEC